MSRSYSPTLENEPYNVTLNNKREPYGLMVENVKMLKAWTHNFLISLSQPIIYKHKFNLST